MLISYYYSSTTCSTPLQNCLSAIDKLIIEDWKPPFRLTNDERKIVQTPGTVLVLGRSGTGKVRRCFGGGGIHAVVLFLFHVVLRS